MTTNAKDWAALLDDPDIREVGGEHNNDGVDFARYWAMALILELEAKGLSDYAIVFEYLQDVAYFDSSSAPTSAVLYQIKKKAKGEWKRSALCSRRLAPSGSEVTKADDDDKGTKVGKSKLAARSPLGKLQLCVEKLSTVAPTEGVFVSNAPYALKRQDGAVLPQYSKHCVSILCSEDYKYISSKLKEELKKDTTPDLKSLHVEQSRIGPETMRETVRGMLDEYLHKTHSTLPAVSGRLQESLLKAFSSRSGTKPQMNDLGEVLKHKGFPRSEFNELIEGLASAKAFSTALDGVIASLKMEGLAPRKADQLALAANRLQIRFVQTPETKDALNWELAVESAKQHGQLDTYSKALDQIRISIEQQWGPKPVPANTDLTALALLALIHVDQEP